MEREERMNREMQGKSGIVFVLKNEAMPGYIKIGKAKDLKQRMAGLDTCAVAVRPAMLTFGILA
jgi:hypothetical protein